MSSIVVSYQRSATGTIAGQVNTALSAAVRRVYLIHSLHTLFTFEAEPTADVDFSGRVHWGVVPTVAGGIAMAIAIQRWVGHTKTGAAVEFQPMGVQRDVYFNEPLRVPQLVVVSQFSGVSTVQRIELIAVYSQVEVSQMEWITVNGVWGADVDQPHPPRLQVAQI